MKTNLKHKKNSKHKNSAKAFYLILFALLILILAAQYLEHSNKPSDTENTNISENTSLIEGADAQLAGQPTAENNTNGGQQSHKELTALENSRQASKENGEDFLKELEIPVCGRNPSESHEIIGHTGYALCYREDYEQPEWVAYCFTKEELVKNAGRSNNFHADPNVSTGSATPEDYTKSGYDRGHLVPAADLSWSEQAMDDSFYMSNMSPQSPSFNRGIWKKLEEQTREWVKKFGTVYVVSGPVLEKNAKEYSSIGKNEVSVPEYYYKALLAQDLEGSFHAIGFLLPNEKCSGTIYDFAATIDEVEKRTNLDFFSKLPDKIENSVESVFSISDWL